MRLVEHDSSTPPSSLPHRVEAASSIRLHPVQAAGGNTENDNALRQRKVLLGGARGQVDEEAARIGGVAVRRVQQALALLHQHLARRGRLHQWRAQGGVDLGKGGKGGVRKET